MDTVDTKSDEEKMSKALAVEDRKHCALEKLRRIARIYFNNLKGCHKIT